MIKILLVFIFSFVWFNGKTAVIQKGLKQVGTFFKINRINGCSIAVPQYLSAVKNTMDGR
jgi:hypothetical protein